MLLSVNLMLSDRFADVFDQSAQKAAAAAGMGMEAVRPGGLPPPGELDRYSHLLLSGSEASVMDDQPWDGPLAELVKAWTESNRPVLGICYGHQFLARVLLGPQHTRRAKEPEFGFRRLETRPHPLFEGIDPHVFLCCHQDEVCDLPSECRVFAASDLCAVQAASFGREHILGVQFHPEYGHRHGEDIFVGAESWCPGALSRVKREHLDAGALDRNWRLMVNFLRMQPR